jgi:glycerate kinase
VAGTSALACPASLKAVLSARAAAAALGADLVPGATTVLDLVGFDASRHDVVVTGEGRVDATTLEGKVPMEVARRSERCVVFGGVVSTPVPGAQMAPLSGEPARAERDLVRLGRRLGLALLDPAR